MSGSFKCQHRAQPRQQEKRECAHGMSYCQPALQDCVWGLRVGDGTWPMQPGLCLEEAQLPPCCAEPTGLQPHMATGGWTRCTGGEHQLWQCLPGAFHVLMDGVTGTALDSLTPPGEPGLVSDAWTGRACVLRRLAHLLGFSPR